MSISANQARGQYEQYKAQAIQNFESTYPDIVEAIMMFVTNANSTVKTQCTIPCELLSTWGEKYNKKTNILALEISSYLKLKGFNIFALDGTDTSILMIFDWNLTDQQKMLETLNSIYDLVSQIPNN